MILRMNVGGLDFPFGNPYTNFALTLRLANEACPPFTEGVQTKDYATWGDYFDALVQYVSQKVSKWGGSTLNNAKPDQYDGGQKPGYQGMIEVWLNDDFFNQNVGYCDGGIVVCPYASDKSQKTIPIEYEFILSDPGVVMQHPISPDVIYNADGSTVVGPLVNKILNQATNTVTVNPAPIQLSGEEEGVNWENRRVAIAIRQTDGYDASGRFIDYVKPGTIIGYADGEQESVLNGKVMRIAQVRTFANKVPLFFNADDLKYQ